jgi:hypothetical protein
MVKFIIHGLDSIDASPSGGGYTLQLNPESIKRNRAIVIEAGEAGDTGAQVNQYKTYGDETMDLDFFLDCTGAIPGSPDSVDDEIESLSKTIYDYAGEIHKPKYLFVEYGSFSFRCMMTAFNTEYMLFDQDGKALRAKIHLALKSVKQSTAKKSSPDMSHAFTIREGDSLPLLCKEVYGKMDYYLQVAAHNGLTNFRELEVGSVIELPPLQR